MAQKFNILEHELVPQHVILSEKEVKKVLETYAIEKEQLPKIFNTDPVIKEIGAKPGQVVKIIRKSKIAGEAVIYRLVIDSKSLTAD